MQAVQQRGPGGPEVLYLDQTDLPELRPGEMMIRVEASAVNRADTLQRRGLYPPPPGTSHVLGLECAGRVVKVAEGSEGDWREGQEVMALLAGGGYAQYAAVQPGHVMRVPRGLDMTEAAAIPEVWLTAYQLLHLTAELRPGQTVLVHAGGSGVATAAVQLVRLAGATSFVTAGTDSKVATALSLGAAAGANYRTDVWREEVSKWSGGRGVDVILDCIGSSYFSDNLHSLAQDGRWVIYGLMGGPDLSGPLLAGLLKKRARLLFTTLRTRTDQYKTDLVSQFTKNCLHHFEVDVVLKSFLILIVLQGPEPTLRPIVDCSFSVLDVVKAHRKMEENANNGKIVLRLDVS